MTLSEGLQLYCLSHALLAVSYLGFTLTRRVLGFLKNPVLSHPWIRVGQVLVALSILSPAALHLIPGERLPGIELNAFRPFPEGDIDQSPQKKPFALSKFPEVKKSSDPFRETRGAVEGWISDWAQGMQVFTAGCLMFLGVGFAFFSVRLARNAIRLRGLVQRATLIRGLGRVRVAVSDEIAVPFSARIRDRSWVLVPFTMLEHSRDLSLALRHELQHHRQSDTAWANFIEVLICVFFPNPAIYLWKREINELQEFSCDEALIGRRGVSMHEYGSCLVRVAEAALGSRHLYVGTTCMAAATKNPFYSKSQLRRRIEMFANHDKSRARRWVSGLMGTLTVLMTVALAYGAEQTLRSHELHAIRPGTASVDPQVQKIADHALQEAVKSQNAKAGFAIVADPVSGRVLAIANVDTTGKRSGRWALSQGLEPASLTKSLVAAQAIEKELTHPQEKHRCENGNYRYANRMYHDWKKEGWDQLTTEETIAWSGDICTIKIGERIGADGLVKMLVDFGFGPEGTAKDFPGARPGVLPLIESPVWPELVPAVSAGYGFLATPLELLQAYGAIANGGKLMKAIPADSDDANGQVIRQVLTPEHAFQMKEILRQVVLKGTAKGKASSRLFSTAGKTSTSFLPDLTKRNLLEGKKKGNFAGFIGFAPVSQPRVVVYVGILDPNTDGSGAHGSTHAAPVFREIVEGVLKSWGVEPDQRG